MHLFLAVTSLAAIGGDVPLPEQTTDAGFWDIARMIVAVAIAGIPLGLSLWALLDAARRPRWAWALADKPQVVWMGAILFGTLSIVFGPLICGWYLVKVRPVIARAEAGSMP